MTTQQPLSLRMYFQKHMIELVRLVGYDGIPVDRAPERLKPLIERYGEAVMRAAADELVEIDGSVDPAVGRLTPHARKLAIGILGRPPENSFRQNCVSDSPAIPDADSQSEPTTEVPGKANNHPWKPVKRSRKEVLIAFRKWLTANVPEAEEVDRKTPKFTDGVKLATLDFILHRSPKQLLTVRRFLTQKQRDDMARWQKVYGPKYRLARIWPVESNDGWIWNQFPIELPD